MERSGMGIFGLMEEEEEEDEWMSRQIKPGRGDHDDKAKRGGETGKRLLRRQGRQELAKQPGKAGEGAVGRLGKVPQAGCEVSLILPR